MQLLERVIEEPNEEERLLARQVEVYKDVIKRRDPKITIVPGADLRRDHRDRDFVPGSSMAPTSSGACSRS